ncbi:MAG TPA: sulfite exporter TauE/SafE family protein [Steroidobacteraceae bacterium]|nr:sulfite exporter TauE/SafE family protein [Steroidobacteraceae bacterium]
MILSSHILWLIPVGFFAQMVDGCVGMGYGISSSSILATLGIPPLITSATVHAAEVVTAGVSSASHAWFRNLDRRIFLSLLAPGVVGGVLGATVLAHIPTHTIRPFVWSYLIIIGLCVVGRVVLGRNPPIAVGAPGPALGLIAGFLDAIGGGGWGTIVTSTMIARGVAPRYAIGTANAVDFFVALATSIALWTQIGAVRYDMVIALLIGGAAAAPLAAWVTRHVPARAAATAVGLVVVLLGTAGLLEALL